MSLYLMVPLIVPILNFLKPLNTSRPYIYLYDVDYSFDREIYYYPVLVHSYIATILGVISMVINDTSYISLTQHACGLFAAIGYRLENLTLTINLKKNSFVKDVKVTYNKCESNNDIIYHEMILLLWKHQLTLEYIDLVESFFKIYLLIMIIMNFICMSLLGFQIIVFMNKKAELLTYIAMLIAGFIHLFVLSYPGQELMDHSADIFYKAYNMLWYRTSRRTTQLLSILLYRSFVPCTLTAGNMYVMSLQNYASVLQATLSYFTTLSSFK
ncbi:OR22C protein, partial [Acromyrmex heyeri]